MASGGGARCARHAAVRRARRGAMGGRGVKRRRAAAGAQPQDASWHSIVEHGGAAGYRAALAAWVVGEGALEAREKKRTTAIVALARVIAQGRDAQWAGVVPHGLRKASGSKVPPHVRGDAVGRAALDELLTAALTLTLSQARCDDLCKVLLTEPGTEVPPVPDAAVSGTEAAPPASEDASERARDSRSKTDRAPASCASGALAAATASAKGIAIGTIMGPILADVSAACNAPAMRSAECAAVVHELASAAAPSSHLLLRCLALQAAVGARDAKGAAEWARVLPRDRVPKPLREEAEALIAAPANDPWDERCPQAGKGGEQPQATQAASAPLLLEPLPEHLGRAGELAAGGWGRKLSFNKRGRHGAVLVRLAECEGEEGSQDCVDEVLGSGVNSAEGPDGGGVRGKFVVHAEMAALREAVAARGLRGVRGTTVYVARLAPQGEAFECGAPCENCEAALRAAGVGGAIWTTEAGQIGEAKYGYHSVREEDFTEEHRQWAGIKDEPGTAPN